MSWREELKEEYQNLKKASGGDLRFWKPSAGKHIIRLLPSIEEGEPPIFKYIVHNLGDLGKARCRKTLGQDEFCPVCDWIQSHVNDPDEEIQKIIKQLRPTLRWAANVVVKSENPTQVQIWTFPKSVAMELMGMLISEDYIYIDDEGNEHGIESPQYGLDLVLTVNPQTISDYYKLEIKMTKGQVRRTPIHDDPEKVDEILASRFNLKQIFSVPESEELMIKLQQFLSPESVSEDEDE